jgi:hypothetical protein
VIFLRSGRCLTVFSDIYASAFSTGYVYHNFSPFSILLGVTHLDFKILILLIAIYAMHNADSIKINRLGVTQLKKSIRKCYVPEHESSEM